MPSENEIQRKEAAVYAAGLEPLKTLGTASVQPAPKLEVPSMVDTLDHELAVLNDALYELLERIEPVLRQEPINTLGEDRAVRGTTTYFGGRLNDLTERATSMNLRVRSAINKLEV